MTTLPELSRETRVLAFSFLSYTTSSTAHRSLVPREAFELATAIAQLYPPPTPFAQRIEDRRRSSADVLNDLSRRAPGTRRPSLEANDILGYPYAWSLVTETRRKVKSSIDANLQELLAATVDLRNSDEYTTWLENRQATGPRQSPESSTSESALEETRIGTTPSDRLNHPLTPTHEDKPSPFLTDPETVASTPERLSTSPPSPTRMFGSPRVQGPNISAPPKRKKRTRNPRSRRPATANPDTTSAQPLREIAHNTVAMTDRNNDREPQTRDGDPGPSQPRPSFGHHLPPPNRPQDNPNTVPLGQLRTDFGGEISNEPRPSESRRAPGPAKQTVAPAPTQDLQPQTSYARESTQSPPIRPASGRLHPTFPLSPDERPQRRNPDRARGTESQDSRQRPGQRTQSLEPAPMTGQIRNERSQPLSFRADTTQAPRQYPALFTQGRDHPQEESRPQPSQSRGQHIHENISRADPGHTYSDPQPNPRYRPDQPQQIPRREYAENASRPTPAFDHPPPQMIPNQQDFLRAMIEGVGEAVRGALRQAQSESPALVQPEQPPYPHDRFMTGGRGPAMSRGPAAPTHQGSSNNMTSHNRPRFDPAYNGDSSDNSPPRGFSPRGGSYRQHRGGRGTYNHFGRNPYNDHNPGSEQYSGFNARLLSDREAKMADSIARVRQMGGSLRFQAELIGFFQPDLSEVTHKQDTVEINGKTHFRNVRDFVDAAQRAVQSESMPEHVIRNNLHLCFKGTAMLWFQTTMKPADRNTVLDGNRIDEWAKVLTRDFRVQPAQAMQKLLRETYSPNDVVKDRSPAEWMMTIVRLCQSAGLESYDNDYLYVSQAWNLLDPRIRLVLQIPTQDTGLNDFIRTMEERLPDLKARFTAKQGAPRSKFETFQDRRSYRPQDSPVTDYNSRSWNDRNRHQAYDRPRQSFPPQQQNKPDPPNQTSNRKLGPSEEGKKWPTRDQRPQNQNDRNYGANGPSRGNRDYSYNRPRNDLFNRERKQYDKVQAAYHNQDFNPDEYDYTNHTTGPEDESYTRSDEEYDIEDNDSAEFYPENWAPGEEGHEDTPDGCPAPTEPEVVNYVTAFTPPRENTGTLRAAKRQCSNCGEHFHSGNKLHQHLRSQQCGDAAGVYTVTTMASSHQNPPKGNLPDAQARKCPPTHPPVSLDMPIVKSSAPTPLESEIRNWYHLRLLVRSSRNGQDLEVCPDTGAALTLGQRSFVKEHFPKAKWEKLKQPIAYGGVGGSPLRTNEMAFVVLYIPSRRVSGQWVYTLWRIRIYIVDTLKPNILLGMDTLAPQQVSIDLKRKTMTQPLCNNAETPISYKPKDHQAGKTRKLTARASTILPAHSVVRVPIHTPASKKLSPACDYEFHACANPPYKATPYNGWMRHDTPHILVRNDSDAPVTIHRRMPLGHAWPCDIDGAYAINPEDHGLAALPPPRETFSLESKMPNGVTIYGENPELDAFRRVVNDFPALWTDQKFIDLPAERWMAIPLKDGWQDHKFSTKVYPLGRRDQGVIDEVFDKLHDDGKMDWATKWTPFGAPVFVTWKFVTKEDGTVKPKGRPVIDLRDVNEWIFKDSYPLTSQKDIMTDIAGARYISVVDGLSYFYQFLVRPEDRHVFAINSHRGQEVLNVAGMGCKNSVQHVQRQGDLILKDMPFARAYVDDFVVYSDTFEDHVEHLRMFFGRLDEHRFSLAPDKAFIAYPTVKLLGQRVDAFGYASTKERLAALRNLKFPRNVADLETYIGAVNYLRDQTPYLAQIIAPLENLKVELTRFAPHKKGSARKKYARSVLLPDLGPIRDAFDAVQTLWQEDTFIHHQNPGRPLYADIDSSKQWGFGACFYHVRGDPEPTMADSDIPEGYEDDESNPTAWLKRVKDFEKGSIEPILFLSKKLTAAETRYFPTELEVAGIAWAVRKARSLIEGAPKTYVFTDHSAAVAIAQQKRLMNTESLGKLNLRLANASMYIQQFDLDVRYRPGRLHLVPDALSRLETIDPPGEADQANTLDDIPHVFHAMLVEMSDDFRSKLAQAYLDDPMWKRTLDVVSGGLDDADDPTRPMRGLRFLLKNGLLYYWDKKDGSERLCIPKPLIGEILRQTHDLHYHQGVDRTYERARASFFIRKLAKHVKEYIQACPHCQLNQTMRHRPYGDLEPIDHPGRPFETVAIDLITHLPETRDGFNALMTRTCHVSKMIGLTPGRDDWSSAEWSIAMTRDHYLQGWGHQRGIISDRDSKFIAGLMNKQFRAMGTEFFTTAAWHPQADGQSERTNQTVEIALRYFITANPDSDWSEAIPHIQFVMNTSPNVSTGITPTEYVYGFNPYSGMDMLREREILSKKDYEALRLQYRDMADEALAFARVRQKHYHDKKHQRIQLKTGDLAFLRLHHGYKLRGHLNRKLNRQRDGPVRILEKIGKNAFRIKVPEGMRIHDVVTAQQLEPGPQEQDPYDRPYPPRVETVEHEDADNQLMVIEYIVKRRVNSDTGKLQYLIKYLDHPHSHNAWKESAELTAAQEMRRQYDEEFPITEQEKRQQGRIRKAKSKRQGEELIDSADAPGGEVEGLQNDNNTTLPTTRPESARHLNLDDAAELSELSDPESEAPRRMRRPRLRDRLNARNVQTTYNENFPPTEPAAVVIPRRARQPGI